MKTVFNDLSQIAHIWANKLQNNAKNSSSNFFFSGKTIYSYGHHFAIAKHVENENGVKAILFTEQSYSHTTSKHISIVRQAASHINRIYCYSPDYTHQDNFNSWLKKVEIIAANLTKAKKPEIYLNQIAEISTKVNTYSSFFSIAIPEELKIALSIQNKDEYFAFTAKKEALKIAEEKKQKRLLAAKHKKELAKWLKGKTNRLYTRDGLDYLRVNGEKIETSQGIDLSIEYGISVYNKLKQDLLKEGDKVLQYEVRKVNGVVSIGCHTFKKSYLLNFGSQLTKLTPVTK
jgi:hypothetical protein